MRGRQRRKVVFSTKVVNRQAAIQALTARAGRSADEVVWAVDMTSGVAGLRAAGTAGVQQFLLDLDRQIKDRDPQLTETFGEHPDTGHITSIPGFGPILGAQLIADTGGDLPAAFGTPARLAAYAGLAPVPRDSGRVKGNLPHTQALIALARRLIDLVWALLRDDRDFQPSKPRPATAAARHGH